MENLTAIEVLAKTTAENLRIKNEEFLAKYPTDDSQIDYYTSLAQKVFDEFEIDGTHDTVGVRKNVEVWFKNKQPQMNLFRKHPYWNEEAKAIVFIQDELRTVDYYKAYHLLAEIGNYICRKFGDEDWSGLHLGIYYALMEMNDCDAKAESTISEEFITRFRNNVRDCDIPDNIQRMLKVGTKITKFTRKCFTQWKRPNGDIIDVTTLVDDHEACDRNYNSFDKLYAKFADALSELVIKKITLVSLHFCDFMLMSNGNSWSSCHYINSHNIFHEDSASSYSGCYKQGCLSYALDKPSFLLYTLPNTYEGEEYYRQPKINRMCCQYEEGFLVTGKCYPDNKTERITRYRQILQLVMSTLEEMPNLWTFSRNTERIKSFVETDEDSAHYRDYESSGQKPTISMCKHRIDLDHVMTIGHKAYCVHCGTSLDGDDPKWLQCSRHRKKPVCVVCGRHIDEDEQIEIDGDYYCEDCCFWCNKHNRYETMDYGKNVIKLANGETVIVCDDGLRSYFRCEGCGEWHIRCNSHYNNNGRYCDDCYQKLKADGKWEQNIDIIPRSEYNLGDYVLMVQDVYVNSYGANYAMDCDFAGKVCRIVSGGHNRYYVTNGSGFGSHWVWDARCFEGQLVGNVSDSILGSTLEELK